VTITVLKRFANARSQLANTLPDEVEYDRNGLPDSREDDFSYTLQATVRRLIEDAGVEPRTSGADLIVHDTVTTLVIQPGCANKTTHCRSRLPHTLQRAAGASCQDAGCSCWDPRPNVREISWELWKGDGGTMEFVGRDGKRG